MSFSSEVKEELSKHISTARHCQIAEIAAIISICGRIEEDESGKKAVTVVTENPAVARKYFTLIQKTFRISSYVSIRRNVVLKKNRIYTIAIKGCKDAIRVLQAIKYADEQGMLHEPQGIVNGMIVSNVCCRRAFIRGAFLASGSISAPEKFYHLEFVCATKSAAEQLKEIVNSFDMDSKIVNRKKNWIVYLKEGAQIVDVLNVMEAHRSLMDLENVRILKEMRNSVNRKVNCETANINKTVSAAVKQIEDINYLKEHHMLEELPENLKEVAELRLANPEASLIELSKMLTVPIGKSGVNHRLRKISTIAEDIRQNERNCSEQSV